MSPDVKSYSVFLLCLILMNIQKADSINAVSIKIMAVELQLNLLTQKQCSK